MDGKGKERDGMLGSGMRSEGGKEWVECMENGKGRSQGKEEGKGGPKGRGVVRRKECDNGIENGKMTRIEKQYKQTSSKKKKRS